MPGPNCQPKITCALCGLKQHKGKVNHKYIWRIECEADGWEWHNVTYNRNEAMHIFRLHKHESDLALNPIMQEAIKNLREQNLI